MSGKIKFVLLALAINSSLVVSSQVTSTFMRTFNGSGMNGGLGLEVTSDGGFIGTGQHESSGVGSCDLYVYKVTGCGDPEWFKTYGSSLEDGGKSIKQTADGGYIITGLTKIINGEYDVWLLKLDASGNVVWNQVIGGAAPDYGIHVNTTSDGGYIVTGFISGLGFGGADIVLIKTDGAGNIQWYKIYGGASEEWGDYVTQTSDGGYVVIGYTSSFGAGGADIYMLKVDGAGTLQWSKTFGTAGDDSHPWGNFAVNTSNGGYVICSQTNGAGAGNLDFWILSIDAAGNVLWSNTYGGVGEESSRQIEAAADGGYIVCGSTNSWGAGDHDAYLVKIDANGNHQWSKVYGGSAIDKATCARATSDGGYSMSLMSTSFGANYYDPVFMKTDSAGNVGCNEGTPGTIVNSFVPTISSGASEGVPVVVISSPVLTPGTFTPVDTFLCYQCLIEPAFAASDTLVCRGQSVDFFNTTAVGLRCHENWEIDGVPITGIDTLTYTFNSVGIFTVRLLGQCGAQADTMSASVFVIDDPVVNFSFTNRCQDSAIIFTDHSTAFALTYLTQWSWDFGDGSPLSSAINPTHQYASPGNYNVTLTVTDNEGCDNTLVKPVTVFPVPVPGFSFSDVCDFNPINFVDASTVLTGSIAGWNWNFGDGSSSSAQHPAHLYPGPNQYQATLTITTDSNCMASLTQSVTVFPAPVTDFSVPNSCLNVTSQFTDLTTVSSGTITAYSWDFGDSGTSALQNPSYTYANPGTYNVVLISETDNGCRDTVNHAVEIYALPVADFVSSVPCAGTPTQFTDSTSPAGFATTFNWDFGDGGSSSSQNPSHLYSAAGSYNVQLISATGTSCSDTILKTVTVRGWSSAQFTAPNVCLNDIAFFTNTMDTLTYPLNSYSWNFGDGTGTSAQASPTYLYGAAGNYSVTMVADFTNGCSDTVTNPITVYVLPTVDTTVTDVSCFGGNDGSIRLTPVIGQTPFTYLWSNSATTGDNTSLTLGNYAVTFTDANQCTATAAFIISEPTLLEMDTVVRPIICYGYNDGSIELVVTGGTPPYSFFWSPGNYSSMAANLSPGIYGITVTDALGCAVSETVEIVQPPLYEVLVDEVVTINLGENVQLNPVAVNGNAATWEWSPEIWLSCTWCQSPLAAPFETYTYTVHSVSDVGCHSTKSVLINVNPRHHIYIPNAITPNGDGVNDYFEVFGNKEAWKQFSLQVFNRIGEKVFETADMNFKWDATYKGLALDPAVFVYALHLVFIDNHTEKMYRGSLTLLK